MLENLIYLMAWPLVLVLSLFAVAGLLHVAGWLLGPAQNIEKMHDFKPSKWAQRWFFCSWLHRSHRCYPEVWLENPIHWHCTKCHPCGEGIDLFLKETPHV